MDTGVSSIILHPQLKEQLFAFKSKVSSIFRDVLGLHEIHHIAVARLNRDHMLSIFSSTPALEYNLFTSPLWLFDRSYQPAWYRQCTQADWTALYDSRRFDELYYLKQIRHGYPVTRTAAAGNDDGYFIFSFASHNENDATRDSFTEQVDDFYKIGRYCANLLQPLFVTNEEPRPALSKQEILNELSA